MFVIIISIIVLPVVLFLLAIRAIFRVINRRRRKPKIFKAADAEINAFQSFLPQERITETTRESYRQYRYSMDSRLRKMDRYNKKIAAAEAKHGTPYTYCFSNFLQWYPLYQQFPAHYSGITKLPPSLSDYGSGGVFSGSDGGGGFDGGGGGSD